MKKRIIELLKKLLSIKFFVFIVSTALFFVLKTNEAFIAYIISMILLVGCREAYKIIQIYKEMKK